MDVPAKYDIRVFRGNTFPLSVRVQNESGEYLDLVGYTFRCHIVDSHRVLVWKIEQTISESATAYTFTLNTDLPAGTYHYEFEMTEPDGTKTTILYGDLFILQGAVE